MTDKAYPEPSPLVRAFKAFMDDYELRGEDDDGREGCYRPNETERLLIEDFVWGLMEDDDWIAASRPAAGSGISDAQIKLPPTPKTLWDGMYGLTCIHDYARAAVKLNATAPATTQSTHADVLAVEQFRALLIEERDATIDVSGEVARQEAQIDLADHLLVKFNELFPEAPNVRA